MLKLCRKDIIAGWWLWLIVFVASVLYGVFPLQTNLAFMLAVMGLVLGCLMVSLILEDRYRTEVYYCSLPLRRLQIVQARYLLTGILAATSLMVAFPLGRLANIVLEQSSIQIDLGVLFTVEGIAGFFFTAALLVSLYLPFYFRQGLGRGTAQFAAAALALALGSLGLDRAARLLFPFRGPLLTPEFLKDPGLSVIREIGNIKDALGTPTFIVLSLALAAAAVAVSMGLAVRFYEKREF